MQKAFEDYVLELQDKIVTTLEKLDPNAPPFFRDRWDRPQGGYGISSFPRPSPQLPPQQFLKKPASTSQLLMASSPPQQ
jgi:coproporphyrinogen III oxidase